MIVKPSKPASGLAIRNAFQYATLEILGNERYADSYEEIEGEVVVSFSEDGDCRTAKPRGDSVLIKSSKGRSEGTIARVTLTALHDEELYAEFEITTHGIEAEVGHPNPVSLQENFIVELVAVAKMMNKRLAMWSKVDTK